VTARLYRVEVSGPAARDLGALAKRPPAGNIFGRIDQAIRALQENPRPPGARKLAAGDEAWRLRVGDYRILYVIDDPRAVVTIGRVLHRSDAYRD
jgi:mRNA interferase RelE/StbE